MKTNRYHCRHKNGKDMCDKHPLQLFKFCPRCGSGNFNPNDARSKRCGDCGFVYYLNASAATAAVILNDSGEVLVSRRAFAPAKGTLDLPGGFVDPGETIDEGMSREIFEETGCRVKSMQWLFSVHNSYRFSGFDVPTADSIFLVRLEEGSMPAANDDAESLQWIAFDKLNPKDFGLDSIRVAVVKVKEMFEQGAFRPR
jgi:NAD+ diphosphatase